MQADKESFMSANTMAAIFTQARFLSPPPTEILVENKRIYSTTGIEDEHKQAFASLERWPAHGFSGIYVPFCAHLIICRGHYIGSL